MNKSSIAVILGLVLLTSAQSTLPTPAAGTFVVWPAEDFVRTNGAPVTVTRTFAVMDPAATYRLHLFNGGRNSQFGRTTSAVITLNGNEILGPSDFHQVTPFIEIEARLSTNNTFSVELRGEPGSGITIEFLGIDTNPPQIVASVNPAPNAAGWNNTNVTVTFVCSDATSNIAKCPEPIVVSTETAGQVVTGTAIDQAGNEASTAVTVKLDNTPPAVTSSRTPDANAFGWNNANVTAHFAATDTLSGIQGGASFDVTLSAEGSGQAATHTFTDVAGNSASGTLADINIDKTVPSLTYGAATPAANSGGWNNSNVSIPFHAEDALAGVASTSGTSPLVLMTEGTAVTGTVVVTDKAGNSQTATSSAFKIDKAPPVVVITSPADGATVTSAELTVTGTATDALSGVTALRCNSVTVSPVQSLFSCNLNLNAGSNPIVVDATDLAGNTRSVNETVSYAVPPPPTPGLPPDPASIAPALPLTQMTTFGRATDFLYTGANAVQTGVVAGAIEPIRAAVVRGRVITRDGAPLSGVKIRILSHAEFGQTLSRADGKFDLAVNGGGSLVVHYEKTGFLPAQRQIDPVWQDFASAPEVALIPLDTQATLIDLSTPPGGLVRPAQIARGSVMTDSAGTRQATLLFPAGTMADMVMANGSTTPLLQMKVRATEYTVGPRGPQAMPGTLPPTSGYTYAVELTADEALAVQAREIRFSTPLPLYVDNFLGFPVGTIVPLGSYDGTRAAWVPEDSGRVIKVLSIATGVADIDVTGDDVADTGYALSALGITDMERHQLAGAFAAGQSLWRARVAHFSAWDINWAFAPPEDGKPPDEDPDLYKPWECQSKYKGSIIGCQNQTLGEEIGISGTPLALRYESDRTPGHKAPYTLEIPLARAQLPPNVLRIELVISVAGQVHTTSFPPIPNQRTSFTWDGKDVYGRTLQGVQRINVRIGYTYQGVYTKTSRFGYNGGGAITGSRTLQQVTLWRSWEGPIGGWDARGVGLGGWTLNRHHTFDPIGGVLYRGDGLRQSTLDLGPVITTVAGGVFGGQAGCDGFGDGGPATQAEVCARGLAVAPDGSIYIADLTPRIRRVAPNGIITTVAGTGVPGFSGDGGPATQAKLNSASAIALGPDGSLYIGDFTNHRVRRVNPSGIITTFAGNGNTCPAPTLPCGDGGPATLATVTSRALAVASDGTLYISDGTTRRVRRVGPDGIISTVAGTGGFCSSIPFGILTDPCGDGGLATSAPVNAVSLALGPEGSLYLSDADLNRVRRVTTDGIIRTVAGTGALGFSGDGGSALQARFQGVEALALGRDGSIYVVDSGNRRIRWLRPDGTINTLAGNGEQTYSGDGGLATRAGLENTQADNSPLALGPDGSVYAGLPGFFGPFRVRRIASRIPGLRFDGGGIAASWDGGEVYVLDPGGRHLRTLDSLTGTLQHEFAYDSAGRLASITDAGGNATTIERDAAGRATAIVAPFGQRTTLATSADGYLERISGPTGGTAQAAYTGTGLITDFMNPRGNTSRYAYDAQGRLIRATDSTGASQTLTRVGTNRDYTVTRTSPLGQSIAYHVERLASGEVKLTTTSPDGQVQSVTGTNGSESTTLPDGTTISIVFGHDPRWGMQSPMLAGMTVRTPGGRVQTRTTQRTATLSNPTNLLSLSALTETTTVNGLSDTISYNAAARTITHTSSAGRRDTIVVDARGRPSQHQYANLNVSTFTYDSRGRVNSATSGSGATARLSQLAYGVNGYLSGIVEPLNHSTAFTSDAGGRVTEQTMPGGSTARFNYDANSNLTSITPPGKSAHAFEYTERDETSRYRPPMIGVEVGDTAFVYDQDGKPLRVDSPGGEIANFSYDAAGRLSRLELPSGSRDYSYDSAGRLASVSAGGIGLGYTYDGPFATGTTWTGSMAGSVSQNFDNNFRVTSLSVNGSNPIAMLYDSDGLPTQAGALTMTRNAQSGFVTATTLSTVSDATTVDSFGDVTSYTASHNGSLIYAITYGRDSLGRIANKNETVNGATRGFAYAYDSAGRLREVRQDGVLVATYDYDSNGNRLTGGATYDAQDRLTQYGTTSYLYTSSGNLTRKTMGNNITVFRYDGLNTLMGVTLPDGRQIDYLLDGEDRRVGKKINGTLTQGWLYQDALRPIAELDAGGVIRSRFVYAGSGNVPAYMIRGGVTYRLIVDHLGSPRLVIDAATGAVVQELDYDAFGVTVRDTNPGFQPFGFAGGLYDPDTRLVRFGLRDYDAETGRWTTKDPIGFLGGDGNLYAYVSNDPVNSIDPVGMAPALPPPGSPLWTNVLKALGRLGYSAEAAPAVAETLAKALGGLKNLRDLTASGGLPKTVKDLVGLNRIPGAGQGGFINVRLSAVLASFAVGYIAGSLLDQRFCLSARISDGMILDHATELTFNQFIKNRGGNLGLKDLGEFQNRCAGGSLSAFCVGFSSQ